MLPINISQADIATIKVEKKIHTCVDVRKRCQILWMLHHNFSHGDTACAVDCHSNTVTNVVKMYNKGGIDSILRVPGSAAKHPLKDKLEQVAERLRTSAVHTLEEAQQWLSKHYDYQVSTESVRKLLKRLGFRRLKANPFPGNARKLDEWLEEQDKWVEHLYALHAKAKEGEIDMAFCDAMHAVYGKFCTYYWTDQAVYKPTGSGRHRLNVYGAYDPISGRVLTNYGEGKVDADYVVDFLKWLRKHHYPKVKRPLHLMMDNARYQHCAYVREEARKLNIVLEFQPAYSPNLNLIERVWKYIKSLVGRCYYETKMEFFKAITDILETTDNPIHQDNFKTLLTMKFQTYSKSQIHGC